MSRYEKLIKEATKPKPGAPKAKYIDPIIASSFSQDGSLQDMCRALSSRLNDSSSLVVMRSLIVIHTLIRNGGVDNVLSAMSGSGQGSLRLRSVVQGGNWQGYDAPKILSPYAAYLDDRIRAFRELRHDVIRAADAARTRGGDRSEGVESGLRLRRLTVEKGLLREVGVCQKVCSRLLDVFFAFFSGENTREELALTAFRMSLKDLLAVYAAINEGVINVLEHYFEMSKVDATNALEVYKRFCTHTEKIVAFLSSARKIAHHLNINIPNLRHAPVSLAGALKEYLDDPNFEKNRQEYKENKRVADGKGAKSGNKDVEMKKAEIPASSSKKSITIQEPPAEEKAKPVKPPTSNQALQDFFESIETDQMSMFGPGAQQQGFMMPQATGFQPAMMGPQMTGYNPFFGQQSNFIAPQQTAFLQQPQVTGFAQGGFLSPQMTGANPFRQNVMMQPTGAAFGAPGNMFGMQPTGLPQQQPQEQQQHLSPPSFGQQANSAGPFSSTFNTADIAKDQNAAPAMSKDDGPQRSASVPLPKALLPQKTGSRNPFAPPPGSTPPPTKGSALTKGPTLFELAYGGAGGMQGPSEGGGGNYGLGSGAWNGSQIQPQQQTQAPNSNPSLIPQKTGLIGNIASEFINGAPTANGNHESLSVTPTNHPTSSALTSEPTEAAQSQPQPFQPSQSFLSSLPSHISQQFQPLQSLQQSQTSQPFQTSFTSQQNQPTSNSNTVSSAFSGLSLGNTLSSPSPSDVPSIQPQATGFGGSLIKPFKPESNFGQNLSANENSNSPAPIPANMTGNPFAKLGMMNGSNVAPSTNNPNTNNNTTVPSQTNGFNSSLF